MKSKVKIWFSGFFAAAALAHLIRSIFHLPMTIGTFDVPISFSVGVFVAAGVISIALLGICPFSGANKCSR